GVHVLDHVPHRSAASRLDAGKPGRRPRRQPDPRAAGCRGAGEGCAWAHAEHRQVNASTDVVLVHGLWMTGTELFLLRRRLERAGFRVHRFRYSTVGASVAENAARLFEFVKELDVSTLHFVGYSLGGIVTLRMLAEHHHALLPGRVVFLGSPLHGSRAAAHLAKRRWGRRLLGRAIDAGLLDDHGMHWRHAREAAVIAGNRPMGLGLFTGALPEPNDGTV